MKALFGVSRLRGVAARICFRKSLFSTMRCSLSTPRYTPSSSNLALNCIMARSRTSCSRGVKLPSDIRDFVVVVGNQNGEIAQGFCSMDGRLYNDMHYQSWLRMKDARADDDAYRTWFDVHRVKPGDIVCQRNEAGTFGYQPLMSIVVPCYKTDKTYLQELIDSVEAQSYGNWELLLVDASPERGVVANACVEARDSRIVRIPLKEEMAALSLIQTRALRPQRRLLLLFLDHDDLLEPDALFRYARALTMRRSKNAPRYCSAMKTCLRKRAHGRNPCLKPI